MSVSLSPSPPAALLATISQFTRNKKNAESICGASGSVAADNERILFHQEVMKMNDFGKPGASEMVITDLAVYFFRFKSYTEFQRRLSIHDLGSVVCDTNTTDVLLRVWERIAEADCQLSPSAPQRVQIIEVLQQAFLRLVGAPLGIVRSAGLPAAVTKKEAQSRPSFHPEIMKRRRVVCAAIAGLAASEGVRLRPPSPVSSLDSHALACVIVSAAPAAASASRAVILDVLPVSKPSGSAPGPARPPASVSISIAAPGATAEPTSAKMIGSRKPSCVIVRV